MRVRTQCKECGLPFKASFEADGGVLECPACDDRRTVSGDGWSEADRRVDICPVCSCKHLYRQRDVHRGWGCLLVVIGAIFVPWTYGLSLIGLSLVDLWLYRRLPDAVVCYRCDTVFRDAVPQKRQKEFDLLKHDVLKFGKDNALEDTRPSELRTKPPELFKPKS